MVRKITSGEYLKRVDNMTAAERQEYLNRVGDWLSVSGQSLTKKGDVFEARMQNVLQVSVGWNDQECAAFEEGAVLLSALVGVADTKLPELLYAISAKRSIKRMFQLLWETEAEAGWTDISGGTAEHPKGHAGKGGGTAEHPDSHTSKGEGTAGEPADTVAGNVGEPADTVAENAGEPADTVAENDREPADTVAGNDGEPAYTVAGNDADAAGTAAVPVRPKHIDQYVHLLPKKTQEHAALVQELYREMDVAREKLRLLMNDATASAADREAWAKKATKCDNTLRKIFVELDAEWAKLVKEGRVVVDDLGNARVIATADAAGTVANDSGENAGEPADTVAGNDGEPADTVAKDGGRTAGHPEDGGLTSEQKARRRELRKWLVDTRRGNGGLREERVKKWYENFREYLTLEGDAAYEDEKIKEAIEHYGIDVEKLRQ